MSGSLNIGYDRMYLRYGLGLSGEETGDKMVMSGGNVDVSIAYGFHELVSAYIEASGASVNAAGFTSAAVGHFDVGVRVFLGARPAELRPFLVAAFNARTLFLEDGRFEANAKRKFEFTGRGATIGVGAHSFFQRNLALNLRLARTVGNFNSVRTTIEREDADDDRETTRVDRRGRSTRVSVGLVWFFLR
jgi:hypothetical protein